MPELHLRQPGFTCRACGPKHHKSIQKSKEIGDLNYIYKNKLDKACFAHNAVYAKREDLARRNVSDKICKDRDYEIALNPRYDGYQTGLVNWCISFLIKK